MDTFNSSKIREVNLIMTYTVILSRNMQGEPSELKFGGLLMDRMEDNGLESR